jgi:hypothetical protein
MLTLSLDNITPARTSRLTSATSPPFVLVTIIAANTKLQRVHERNSYYVIQQRSGQAAFFTFCFLDALSFPLVSSANPTASESTENLELPLSFVSISSRNESCLSSSPLSTPTSEHTRFSSLFVLSFPPLASPSACSAYFFHLIAFSPFASPSAPPCDGPCNSTVKLGSPAQVGGSQGSIRRGCGAARPNPNPNPNPGPSRNADFFVNSS